MSRVPAVWSSTPAVRNSDPLNSACAPSIAAAAAPASGVPDPASTVRNPSWLTVPYASSSFRSYWRSARQPPRTMLDRPTATTSGRHGPAAASAGENRASR